MLSMPMRIIFLKPGFIEEMLIRGESKNRQKDHRYMTELRGFTKSTHPPLEQALRGSCC